MKKSIFLAAILAAPLIAQNIAASELTNENTAASSGKNIAEPESANLSSRSGLLTLQKIDNPKKQDFEFAAGSVEKIGTKIYATGGVLIYSQDYMASGERAVYDEANGQVELAGSVSVLRGPYEASHADFVRINVNDKTFDFKSAFAIDKSKEIWVQSQDSCSDDAKMLATGAVVSSCNVADPDWHIEFSSGELNKKSKFLHLYNPVFYIKGVPVAWLPYFGFSTDKTRRTGLLPPQVAVGQSDGLYYAQPIYIAEFNSWDLELTPQIRTSRGVGAYGTLRFVDSAYSRGEVRFGAFEESSSYVQKENLKYKRHYGFELNYDTDRLIKWLFDGDFSEGVWLDYTQLNDVDYLNLRTKKSTEYDSLIQSRLNYFIASSDHYFGLYAKYYFDTAKIGIGVQNDDTLQELPTAHYHKFLQTFFDDHLTYLVDAKARNYTRKVGTTARQYEFELPVGLNFWLIDNWLNLAITENLYMTQVDYQNNYNPNFYGGLNASSQNSSDSYINHYHKISLKTDLARGYESLFHTISLTTDYIKPGYHKGALTSRLYRYYLAQNSTDPLIAEENFIAFQDEKYRYESLLLGATQFFYNADGQKRLRHFISQNIDIDSGEARTLENRIDLYFGGLNFSNKLEYANQNDKITKMQTLAGLQTAHFDASIWHTYARPMSGDFSYDKESYISASLGVPLPYNYKLISHAQYDLQKNYAKSWQVGLNYKRKCWNYSLVYRKDIEPKNTSAGLDSKRSQGVYLLFSFYPLGTLNYDFSVESENKNGGGA